jgi:hypothetical protein
MNRPPATTGHEFVGQTSIVRDFVLLTVAVEARRCE